MLFWEIFHVFSAFRLSHHWAKTYKYHMAFVHMPDQQKDDDTASQAMQLSLGLLYGLAICIVISGVLYMTAEADGNLALVLGIAALIVLAFAALLYWKNMRITAVVVVLIPVLLIGVMLLGSK
jgi:hypothetical protein